MRQSVFARGGRAAEQTAVARLRRVLADRPLRRPSPFVTADHIAEPFRAGRPGGLVDTLECS